MMSKWTVGGSSEDLSYVPDATDDEDLTYMTESEEEDDDDTEENDIQL